MPRRVNLRTMRILLVDDDDWIRDAIKTYLTCEGCNVTALSTAEDGMTAFNACPFDLVISDYRLPAMDGLTFLGVLIQSHRTSLTVLITGYGNDDLIRDATRLGVKLVIEKPFDLEELERRLSEMLS